MGVRSILCGHDPLLHRLCEPALASCVLIDGPKPRDQRQTFALRPPFAGSPVLAPPSALAIMTLSPAPWRRATSAGSAWSSVMTAVRAATSQTLPNATWPNVEESATT